MKVLVISDTHGNIINVMKILKRIKPLGVKTIIHCGDHWDDMESLKRIYPEIEIYAVFGNCDGIAQASEYNKTIQIEGVSIFITHGHKHGVRWGDYDELLIHAMAEGAHLAICGHTHAAYLEKKKGIILLNPGSISSPRDSEYPSYGILEIDASSIKDVAVMQIIGEDRVCTHPVCNIYRSK